MTRVRRERLAAFAEFRTGSPWEPQPHAGPSHEITGDDPDACSALRTESTAKDSAASRPDGQDDSHSTEMPPTSLRMAPLPSTARRRPEHAKYYLILKPVPPVGQSRHMDASQHQNTVTPEGTNTRPAGA